MKLQPNATELLKDLIRLDQAQMTKAEITKRWKGTDWGSLRPWAIAVWKAAGL